jgi:prepilin-type N-terminal cleavage/methylation domain-containing protein
MTMRDHNQCCINEDERKRLESGFSLIELIVGVTVFVIIMGAIYGLLELGRSGRLNTTQRSEVLQNMRIAINTMGRDLINAGVDYPNQGAAIPDNSLYAQLNIANLAGESADADNTADFLTPVFARNDVNKINNKDTDQIMIAFNDDTFNNGVNLSINQINNNGQVLRLATGDTSACNVGDIYVITGQSGSALGMLTAKTNNTLSFVQGDPLGINGPNNANNPIGIVTGIGAQTASVERIVWVTYYVADEDGNGTGTGTMRRRVYGGSTAGVDGYVDQPLAFGVENLQIQYVLDTGAVVDTPDDDKMQAIRQVKVSVTVRSPDRDPKTNKPFESTISSTFSTRNLTYEKL